jgi:predicted nucleic acid-binding protein
VNFVLDASVALSWLLRDASERNDAYAFVVLKALRTGDNGSEVPVTFALELADVIVRCEMKDQMDNAQIEAFLEMLRGASITVDSATATRALSETLQLARRYRLASYDSSYLELALRRTLPLATLDEDLRCAASKADVKHCKPSLPAR